MYDIESKSISRRTCTLAEWRRRIITWRRHVIHDIVHDVVRRDAVWRVIQLTGRLQPSTSTVVLQPSCFFSKRACYVRRHDARWQLVKMLSTLRHDLSFLRFFSVDERINWPVHNTRQKDCWGHCKVPEHQMPSDLVWHNRIKSLPLSRSIREYHSFRQHLKAHQFLFGRNSPTPTRLFPIRHRNLLRNRQTHCGILFLSICTSWKL